MKIRDTRRIETRRTARLALRRLGGLVAATVPILLANGPAALAQGRSGVGLDRSVRVERDWTWNQADSIRPGRDADWAPLVVNPPPPPLPKGRAARVIDVDRAPIPADPSRVPLAEVGKISEDGSTATIVIQPREPRGPRPPGTRDDRVAGKIWWAFPNLPMTPLTSVGCLGDGQDPMASPARTAGIRADSPASPGRIDPLAWEITGTITIKGGGKK